MLRLQSEAPCLHLERARAREGGSKTAWCAGVPTVGGGVPGQGVVVEGVKGVKYAPLPPEMYENGGKTGGLPECFGL